MVDEPISDEELSDEELDQLVEGSYHSLDHVRIYGLAGRLARELRAARDQVVEQERAVVAAVVDDLAEALAVPVSSPDGHEERRLTYREAVDWVGSRTRMWSALLRRVEEVDPQWLAELRGETVPPQLHQVVIAPRVERRCRHGKVGPHEYPNPPRQDALPAGVSQCSGPLERPDRPYIPKVGDPAQTTLTGVITEIDYHNGYIWLLGSAAGGHVPWTFKLHWGAVFTRPGELSIYDEIQAERQRAHTKHGATSMETTPVEEMYRAVILGEEIGEVSEVVWAALWALALTAAGGRVDTVMNDGRHSGQLNRVDLRRELLQTATMAASWADRIPPG